ncbi:hypothetical protein A9P82_05725 [Arachidicoccus ginsenosidimutans]|uniref:hypothetical protein n=1 Tax=Arachidicoccus sp. BS20 TaxID=1850526 RepID=UPI0007F058AD|nr:hypothetical protein [Arachidicoccus sp. BS20]ANI88830.1 hypothetical protein A9P82_05725 [Arachidicoccus sp. BS20]
MKQKSFLKLRGTIDDLTFYRTKDGHLVRKAGGIDRQRILTSPDFERTRENMNEFKTISAATHYFRVALADVLKKTKDYRLGRRLFRLFGKIKNMDTVSARGARQVTLGLAEEDALNLLRGFDFNSNASLSSVLHAPYTFSVAEGKVDIDAFDPAGQVEAPAGATHVSLQSVAVVMDFASGVFKSVQSEAVNMSLDAVPGAVTLQPETMPGGTGFLMLLLLVEFFQEVNGTQYPLNNGGYNVLNLLDIEPAA